MSCLNDSWTLIREQAVASAHHRFPTLVQLRDIPSAEVGEALVAAYLRAAFARAEFAPEYPTWPVRSTAFADAPLFSPRSLINVVQDHCARCRENGRVTELEQLPNERPRGQADPTPVPPPDPDPDPDPDRRFSQLVREADVADALDEKKVDGDLPALLRAGLTAWAKENGGTGDFSVDPPLGRNPSLHARLRRIVDADTDDEVHWSFRAVLNDNAVSALHRLRAAVTASGLELSGERRRLFILRNATTQFFGLLNAPTQIAAAREMAAQKGGDARNIARLRPGEFFAASDAVTFQRVRSPMCLSHHPRSPMTQEEVLELARGNPGNADRSRN